MSTQPERHRCAKCKKFTSQHPDCPHVRYCKSCKRNECTSCGRAHEKSNAPADTKMRTVECAQAHCAMRIQVPEEETVEQVDERTRSERHLRLLEQHEPVGDIPTSGPPPEFQELLAQVKGRMIAGPDNTNGGQTVEHGEHPDGGNGRVDDDRRDAGRTDRAAAADSRRDEDLREGDRGDRRGAAPGGDEAARAVQRVEAREPRWLPKGRGPFGRIRREVAVTRRTWPARAPLAAGGIGMLAGAALGPLGAIVVGGASWWATRAVHRHSVTLSQRYRGGRDELALLDEKKWSALVGAIWELPREGLEQSEVPAPKLIDADCSQRHATTGGRYEQLWVQPSPHSKNPSDDYLALQHKIARVRGAVIPEHVGTTFVDDQPPVLQLLINYDRNVDDNVIERAIVTDPGVFHLGTLLSGEPIVADPFATVNPLWLVAGESGSGKSSVMTILCDSVLRFAPWDLTVIDGNFGADYVWVTERGGELVLGPGAGRARMKSLLKEIDERNTILGERKWTFTRDDGATVKRHARKLSEVPDDQLEEFRDKQGWVYRALIIDEAQRVVGDEDGQKVLQAIVAGARKAGVMVVLGIHRPSADIIGGYSRDQFSTRILLGKPRKATARMVNEDEGTIMAAFEVSDEWPAGVGTFDGVGLPPIRRPRKGRAFFLHPDYLVAEGDVATNHADSPPVGGRSAGSRGAGKEREGVGVRVKRWVFGWKCLVTAVFWGVQGRGPGERAEGFRDAVLREKALQCAECGHDGYLEADHVRPLWAGGTNDPVENGQLLCERCHDAKTSQEARSRRWAPKLRVALIGVGGLSALLLVRAMIGA